MNRSLYFEKKKKNLLYLRWVPVFLKSYYDFVIINWLNMQSCKLAHSWNLTGIARTLSNIYDGAFLQKIVKAAIFAKELCRRCFVAGSQIRLPIQTHKLNFSNILKISSFSPFGGTACQVFCNPPVASFLKKYNFVTIE